MSRSHVLKSTFVLLALMLISGSLISGTAIAERKVTGDGTVVPIPAGLSEEHVDEMSVGCIDCHTQTDALTMHTNPAVAIGCADCHGGRPEVRAEGLERGTAEYDNAMAVAHVQPKYPENWPTSGNPVGSYTALLDEPADFVKFINPGDLRVAPETCGGCHAEEVRAVQRSLMTTSAMLLGGASYNNNILPYKNYVLGESYDRDGLPQTLNDPTVTPALAARGGLSQLVPLPTWEVTAPGDNFRVFERGGLFIESQFPEIGFPNPLEEPGKPDILQSNRGVGTGSRVSIPVLNIHKTRLNDPHLSFLGTNDHPGDYRSSGCSGCHVVYANDRSPVHSGPWAEYGHEGKTQTKDPTISREEEGHPIQHLFTRAIPTSQCMICHMHQPNMFVNSYLGYTMWDYESDAPHMWPEKQKHPTAEEKFKSLSHNPEEAATHGLWTDIEFLKKVSELNPKLKNTQFADYHGHGWNFRAVFKKDRKGHLLDEDGEIISHDDPEKFKKAVHMMDIHLEKGMHCVDCHFSQDAHGDGHIYGEVAQAVEIMCKDCHGTIKDYSTLKTSGPAAPDGGTDLSLMRTSFGKARFQWRGGKLYQRSNLHKDMEWEVDQIKDSVTPGHPKYNAKSARAKTVRRYKKGDTREKWGNVAALRDIEDMSAELAHSNEDMACFTCHSSWVTSCAGCHLPIQANWKTKTKHYEGKQTRNWASYNPQVVRDQMFQIGRHGPAKSGRIVPIRSSSALVLSSVDINRQKIYVQQPPSAASGHSAQAFAPHFPHTVRTKETKMCEDCHVSSSGDNNAIMAQLLLHGTNFVNFMGYHVYVGTGDAGLAAVQVTEWDEPQAVIGSYLHKYAYPDWYKEHEERDRELAEYHTHHGAGGETNTVQLRGEYLYTTSGSGGFRIYDVANIANKGFSERIVTAPFSPLGHDTHVSMTDATSFALPTNMAIAPFREQLPENMEDPLHAIYHYAVITDSVEGLVLVNVDTMADRDRTNNFLERAVTWNEEGILNGARHIFLAGTDAYIAADAGLVIVDLDKPLEPVLKAVVPLEGVVASALQFRYVFALDSQGMVTIDVTDSSDPQVVEGSRIPLTDARNLYLARTYAYVAAGKEGLAIVDVEKPEQPFVQEMFTAEGRINDLYDVKVASTNASLFAYLADGKNGLKVVQLTDPERVPTYYGFSPTPKPMLVSQKHLHGTARSISKGLDRDRAVDESGHQVSVLGRIGSRPFYRDEMQKMYLRDDGSVYTVDNDG